MDHINRSGPSFKPKSTLPKASAPGGGSADASSKAAPVTGIKPKDAPLAGYLLARSALNRKIEDPALKNLRAGHDTVQEVNELLPLGRANVREDIQNAKGERPDLRHAAARKLQEAFQSRLRNPYGGGMSRNDFYRMDAATSQYAKTGTCDNYTANATALHAAKLAGMKDRTAIVAQASDSKVGHTWSEMLAQGEGKYGKPILHGEDVVMDGWCKEGLAVLREDSHFARLDKDGRGDHLSHDHLLNHQSGPAVLARVENFKAQIEGSKTLQDAFHNELKRREESGWKTDERYLWDAQSAFHADFRKEAGAALRKEAKHPASAEIQAVGAARSLGANVRGGVAEAPGIIATAKEMLPRPESEGRANRP